MKPIREGQKFNLPGNTQGKAVTQPQTRKMGGFQNKTGSIEILVMNQKGTWRSRAGWSSTIKLLFSGEGILIFLSRNFLRIIDTLSSDYACFAWGWELKKLQLKQNAVI